MCSTEVPMMRKHFQHMILVFEPLSDVARRDCASVDFLLARPRRSHIGKVDSAKMQYGHAYAAFSSHIGSLSFDTGSRSRFSIPAPSV